MTNKLDESGDIMDGLINELSHNSNIRATLILPAHITVCSVCDQDVEKDLYMSELAEFDHAHQVAHFNWCQCEEQEYFPYDDCPRRD